MGDPLLEEGPGAGAYTDGYGHLRDELWRTWLCVSYHIHRRWELGILPRSASDANTGLWSAGNVASLFATAERAHADLPGAPGSADAALAAFRRQSALIEGRVRATLERGVRLPLVDVVRSFDLTRLQRATLTLALMPELDPDLLIAYRYLANDLSCRGLDARLLAIMVYETPESRPHLSLDLSPLSPLIHYRLLDLDEGLGLDAPLFRRIAAAPRLVQTAAEGIRDLDPHLRDAAEVAPPVAEGLFPEELKRRAREALSNPDVILVLQGQRGSGKRMLLGNLAASLGKRLLLLKPKHLLALPKEQVTTVLRGLLREAKLLDAIPVVPDLDHALAHDERRDELPEPIVRLCAEHQGAVAITFTGDHLPRIDQRAVVHLQTPIPPVSERHQLWQRLVPPLGDEGAGSLAERFAIPGGIIQLAAQAARSEPGGATVEALDRAVRSQLHDRLSRMGRRLDAPHTFDDLIVEQNILDTLLEIAACMMQRRRVRESWGFKGAAGVSVLFSGSPGVGKTMSATVLARELGLAVYEIDLSSVVSKWIGETEKNLEEIFTAGEPGHAILLFNEADSLFGKRTANVQSSNDRYANLETNYLLQRLEKFSGMAILTTNLTNAIDSAFRRRFAYDVQFSFPTVEMRAELWRRALPPQADVGVIDFESLAEQFELSGGFIKLALERAAFVAADAGEPLSTDLIVPTVQRMYYERGKLAAVGRLE